mgnify:CR=1 FL=1
MIDKLIDLSLGNRLLVVVLAILLMFAGYWSYNKLPVDAFPDVSPNLVQVFTVTDGLAPEEIEMYEQYKYDMNEQRPGMPIIDIDEFLRLEYGQARADVAAGGLPAILGV